MTNPFPKMLLPQDLAYSFLGTFARCEYALKKVGFAHGGLAGVAADWDAFSRAISDRFDGHDDPEFREAVQFLLMEPPKKQVLNGGHLDWQDSPPDIALRAAQRALLLVRRVRNNLFHGAKVWSPEYENRQRDIRLVEASLRILNHCIRFDGDVRSCFDDGAF